MPQTEVQVHLPFIRIIGEVFHSEKGGGSPPSETPRPYPPYPYGRPSGIPDPLSPIPPYPHVAPKQSGVWGGGPFLLAMQYHIKTMLKNATKYIDFPMLNYSFTAKV